MPKFFLARNRSLLTCVTVATLMAIAPPTIAATCNSPKQLASAVTEPDQARNPLNQTVQNLYNQMDIAANQRNRDALIEFYSVEFTTADGLNRETLSQSIQNLWQQYPQLTYKTEVVNAVENCNAIGAETVTKVTGKHVRDGRPITVDMTVRSKQRWQDNKLIQQEILAEQTRLSLGENPPTVSINLPETVEVGARYRYEAIVEEPLESDILMGEVLDQSITAAALIQPKILQLQIPSVLELIGNREFSRPDRPAQPNVELVKLQRLRAGGFFKSGLAATTPEDRWVSAVLVRHDAGMTIVTQRLRIVEK